MKDLLKLQLANYAGLYQSMEKKTAPKSPSIQQMPELEASVFKAAGKAWEDYSQSPMGKQELAAAENMDLEELRVYVSSLPDKPVFAKLIHWIRSLDLPECSFTIGLSIEVEAIIGFSGTIGVAVGVGNSKGMQSAEFLAVTGEMGFGFGAMVGVQFGLWDRSPENLEGNRWGMEIDLGFEAEMSAGIYLDDEGISGLAITVGIGVEDGIAAVDCYIYILNGQGVDPYLKPVVQPRKSKLLIIESLKCVHPSNDGAGDENEVKFVFKADQDDTWYPYPTYSYFSMKEGDTWWCGRSVWFNSVVSVTVYDDDGMSSGDDVVGTFRIESEQLQLGQSRTFESTTDYSSGMDKVEYTISVKLVATQVE